MVTLTRTLMLVALTAATTAISEAAQEARILRVEKTLERRSRTAKDQNIVGRNYTKFLGSEPLLAREQFDVYWEPPQGGLDAGARMLFEFRREFEEDVQRLSHSFSFAINARRKTSFVVEPDPVRNYGHVVMWRVRLVDKGRVLADTSSASWR